MKQTNKKGFTLAELLIVVAIIAVLVAIAIPVFTTQLHNARVAADLANLRAYYAELQTNYQETGKTNQDFIDFNRQQNYKAYKHLDGSVSSLKTGTCVIITPYDKNQGYTIYYSCNKTSPTHSEHTEKFTNIK